MAQLDMETKNRAIQKYLSGTPASEVAREFGVNVTWIYNRASQMKKTGNRVRRTSSGRVTTTSTAQSARPTSRVFSRTPRRVRVGGTQSGRVNSARINEFAQVVRDLNHLAQITDQLRNTANELRNTANEALIRLVQ